MENPLEWSKYAGLRPYWVAENELAVSPMPRPEDLEILASQFRTVVSLASPAEFVYGGHLDPRLLQSLVPSHVWLIVGEYNAPTLPELAAVLEDELERPVLVHCLRGCGRSPLFATAWLISRHQMRLIEALTAVREKRGCSIETLPQQSLLEAYELAHRAQLTRDVAAYDRDDPRPEYALLFSRTLSWVTGDDPIEAARNSLRGEGFWNTASLLSDRLGYTVAGIRTEKIAGDILVKVIVWVTRRAHPASVKRPIAVNRDEVERSLSKMLSRLLGTKVTALIEVKKPNEVPWV